MAKAFDQLIQTTQFLRNAAPREFDQFRTAFEQYTDDVFNNVLEATIDLSRLQGQAQQCKKLLLMLKEIK